MWCSTFEQRLESWSQLRAQAVQTDSESALRQINAWWFRAPWRAYHLHWDDQLTWPDPWQLLSDNMYCEVARGLGIFYTIKLLGKDSLSSSRMVLDSNNNTIILIDDYILNWESDSINKIQDIIVKEQIFLNTLVLS
jgi:hypothetical protein